jgi:predicted nucleic-acid-binding protein
MTRGRKMNIVETLLTKEEFAVINKDLGRKEYLKQYVKQKYQNDPEYRERKKIQMKKYATIKRLEKKLTKVLQDKLKAEELKQIQEV